MTAIDDIDAAKLRRLEPFEQGGQFGLIVAVHGCDEIKRYYDTAAERDAAMDALYVGWKAARGIKGVRADGGQ